MKKAVLVGVLAALLLPGVAWAAPTGSITNVYPTGTYGAVNATYTVTFDQCTTYGYCGFFAHAWEVPASQACAPDQAYLTYVSLEVPTTSGTITGSEDFYPHYSPTRICLYARGAVGGGSGLQEYFIADYVYSAPTAPAPTPVAPSPTPTPTTTSAPAAHATLVPMTVREARGLAITTLKSKYHSRFSRSTLTRSCKRLSRLKVRCHVTWRKTRFKYSGTVTLWYDQSDADSDYGTYTYSTQIARRRIHKPKHHAPAQQSCDPNYAGACLNPNASDYDCAGGSGDGPYYTGPVHIVGDDHYGLDRDGDGIACES